MITPNYEKIKRENAYKASQYVPDDYGVVDFYPRYIQIEQTNRCNAQCIMCNHFYLRNASASDLNPEVVKKLEKILPYCNTLMLNGDGEPFLCNDILKNIELFSSYGVKIGTNTNLSYIPEEGWKAINDNFEFLNISCDGATKKTYEMIRRGLKYEKFIRNLEMLCETAPGVVKNLDCVIMKQNVNELPNIVRLAAEYSFEAVRFHRLGVNPCIGNYKDADSYFPNLVYIKAQEAKAVGKELGISVEIPFYNKPESLEINEELIEDDFDKEIETRQKKAISLYGHLNIEDDYFSQETTLEDVTNLVWKSDKICRWALERCYVDLKGNVSTCCFNMKKNMGNLCRQTFDEIWNGNLYIEFRKQMAKGYLPLWCKNCNWIKESKF